jgi:cell wall-associated NlpC family hydrolase
MMQVRGWFLAAAALASAVVVAQRAGTPDSTKVIGRLGQAIEATSIHSSMNTRSQAYSKTKAFQHLVVNSTKNPDWLAVVLVNGRNGYVRTEKVAILPYQVTVPAKAPSRSSTRTNTRTSSRNARPTVNSGSAEVDYVLNQSFNYIGTRYRWGGNSLTGGIDCSGFVKELYEKIGVNLPRTAREQARVGKPITRLEDLLPGDRLYFWDRKRGYIGHTGIFLGYAADGGAYFIHSSSRKGVNTDDLRNPHWRNILVGARR